jgi:hypothetical protein
LNSLAERACFSQVLAFDDWVESSIPQMLQARPWWTDAADAAEPRGAASGASGPPPTSPAARAEVAPAGGFISTPRCGCVRGITKEKMGGGGEETGFTAAGGQAGAEDGLDGSAASAEDLSVTLLLAGGDRVGRDLKVRCVWSFWDHL